MQFLLHMDVCLDILYKKDHQLLEKIHEKGSACWVPSPFLLEIQKKFKESEGSIETKILNDFFSKISVLNLTSRELKTVLTLKNKTVLDELTIAIFNNHALDGIITLDNTPFSELNIKTYTPNSLIQLLNEPIDVDKVSILNIPATYPQILEDVEQEIADVVRSGYFILGKKVIELEEEIASYCQSKYAVGVSSGTDALLLSLMAAEIGPGDEVITTPYTFFATAGSIVRTGAKPIFVDIDESTYNLDASQIESKITSKTKAIMPVHLYGQCAEMDPINELAKKNNLLVIEDAAQAIGSEYKGRRAGSLGDFGCFSFFPTKNLGGFGDAGIVTTNSEEFYNKLKILRIHGMEPKYYHQWIGGNFRIDALQAGIVKAKLKFLDGWTEKRRNNASRYNHLFREKRLESKIGLPQEKDPKHIYNQFIIRVTGGKRDELRKFLADFQIASEIYYPIPLHLQKCFESLNYSQGDFPNAEKAALETLALPISNEVTEEQQIYITDQIEKYFS